MLVLAVETFTSRNVLPFVSLAVTQQDASIVRSCGITEKQPVQEGGAAAHYLKIRGQQRGWTLALKRAGQDITMPVTRDQAIDHFFRHCVPVEVSDVLSEPTLDDNPLDRLYLAMKTARRLDSREMQ